MTEPTDKQIDVFNDICPETDCGKERIKDGITDLLYALTLPQIKELAEHRNASVIEWVEFDHQDESTWPESGKKVLVEVDENLLTELEYDIEAFFADFFIYPHENIPNFDIHHCDEASGQLFVKRWTYLPTMKDNE